MHYVQILVLIAMLYKVDGIVVDSESCPAVFKYKKSSGVWSGLLAVNIAPRGLPILVELHLSLKALLNSKYVGLIELSEAAESVVEKIMEHGLRKVEYIVRFPLPHPLPRIQSIKVNGKEICKGQEVSGSIITHIKLEHEFPTNFNIINSEYIKSKYRRDSSCGEFVAPEYFYTIPEEEKWPWLVAILIRKGADRLQFHCTGTLLSHLFVLTAAHCFSSELHLKHSDYVLYLGKHDLSKWGEFESQIIEVKTIHIHPQFKPKTFNADIAVVQLNRPVVYSRLVKPMCLWQGGDLLEPLVDKEGLVIGWGKEGSSDFIQPTPKSVKLHIVNQEECLRSQIDFHYITSTKTFCAGNRNGNGPCNGDSGSAIIYQNLNKGSNHWHLRGLISLSLVNKENNTCDLNHFTVFTDVAKFLPWLISIVTDKSN